MLNALLVFRAARLNASTSRSFIVSVRRSLTSSSSSSQEKPLVRRIKQLTQESDKRLLTITWADGSDNRYPFVYLRDICKCPECFHTSSLQRAFDSVEGLHSDLVATKVDIQEDGKQIRLIWPNKHVTTFDADWLYKRRLSDESEHTEKEKLIIDGGITLKDHTTTGKLPTLEYDDVLNSKTIQLKWLELIRCHGIVLIKGAPIEKGQVKKLGETLGYVVPMWFGDTLVIENNIENDKDASCLSSLPQATSSYNEYRGGLYLIHCLKAVVGTGGEHTFVDGFNVAKQLKDSNPEAFNLLCTSNIMYQRRVANKEKEYDMKFTRPMIRLDLNGHIKWIIYSDTNRATFVNVTPEVMPKLYGAYYEVGRIIRDPMNTIHHKPEPGDIMTCDCDRMFSGRKPFGPDTKGTEVFEIGFTDKDMTNSRQRTLKQYEALWQ